MGVRIESATCMLLPPLAEVIEPDVAALRGGNRALGRTEIAYSVHGGVESALHGIGTL
jgi:hypothetical protein